MADQIETAVRAVMSHPWSSGPWTAHMHHKYDAACAVCQGDIRAILTVAASAGGAVPDDLAATRERINRACTELGEVCAQGPSRRFKMHIPADPERDTDLIISAALNDADLLAGEVERLRATVTRVRAFRDYLATATGATETGALLLKVERNLSDILNGAGAVSEKRTESGHSQTHLSLERVIEVALGLYDGPRTGKDAPPTMAKAVLAALAQHGLAVIPDTEASRCFRLDHDSRLAYEEEAARQAQTTIARFRAWLDTDFRQWCSPHGIAARYATDLINQLDRLVAEEQTGGQL
ncbi:hypothetical protein ACFYOK_37440 [Microbispora bryophytorum]|uniref:hypothetical protein n=1 Tax=Microbispora bryophytorum TaxID=1460882 RepID=UPI0033E3E71B